MILKDTFKNIGMDYVFSLLDLKTPYGKEKLFNLKVFLDKDKLNKEYDEVEFLTNLIKDNFKLYNEITSLLYGIKEIRTTIKRASSGATLDNGELFEIKNFLINIREIYKLQKENLFLESLMLFRIEDIERLLDIENQNSRSFYIYDSYSKDLKEIRGKLKKKALELNELKKQIVGYVEQKYSAKVKQNRELVLSKDDEKYNEAINDKYLKKSLNTPYFVIFNIEFGDEGILIEKEIEELKLKEEEEENKIRQYLSDEIAKRANEFLELTNKVANLDLSLEKANLAVLTKSIRPMISDDCEIVIKNGIHLKVEHELKKRGYNFTPISIDLKKGSTIITGVNMGGKTVTLRLIGLLSMMAQMGFLVPADYFKTCLFEFYMCQAGDMQSLDTGLSTFGAEIINLNEAVKLKDKRGIVLVDEIARGTNPKEGRAITLAILSYFNKSNCIAVFTTHFDGVDEGVRHFEVIGLKYDDKVKSMDLKELNKWMDYRLREVFGKYFVPKDAIKVASLLGFNDEILKMAEERLNT